MATSNRDRVGNALDQLRFGLRPYVERTLTARYGEAWFDQYLAVTPSVNAASPAELDAQGLLKIMRDSWNDCYRTTLGNAERNLVHELIEQRNRWAHQHAFTIDDT